MHLIPKALAVESWVCTIGSGEDYGKVILVPTTQSTNQPATALWEDQLSVATAFRFSKEAEDADNDVLSLPSFEEYRADQTKPVCLFAACLSERFI